MAKNPVFGQFWRKWPFLAIFPEKAPVATGVKMLKKPKNGHFSQKGSKIPDPGGPRAGVLHQPLAPGPRGSRGGEKRGSEAPPGPGLEKGLPGGLPGPSGTPDPRDPRREPRGPAARGWCKTTPAAVSETPDGVWRAPRGLPRGRGAPRDPDPGGLRDPGPRDPVPGPRRGSGRASQAPGSPLPLGVLHQPLAAGPRGSRPGSPGGPETPRSVESLQAAAALEREVVVSSSSFGV